MNRARFSLTALIALMLTLALTACLETPGTELAAQLGLFQPRVPGDPAPADPAPPRNFHVDALVFNGPGAWGAEVSSLESIITSHGASYREVGAPELEAMSLDQLADFGLLIFPGGSGGTEAGSLSAAAHARLRDAVRLRGVSYLGFCAGTFIAVAPAPAPGQDVSYGLGIVPAPLLDYYYLENVLNPDIGMTLETFADGTTRDLLWYGGPVTPNIPRGVVARYPNGDPAITELWSGHGFVMLSAVHPAAVQAIRDDYALKDSDGLDYDVAWSLIESALNQRALPAF